MFGDIVTDIYGVLASSAWLATGIKAFPRNFQGTITAAPYVLVSILPGATEHLNLQYGKEICGLLILSVFLKTDKGDKELFQIGDKLNAIFERKQLPNGTQMGIGSLKPIGIDNDNSTLYRGDYSITFNLYGD